MLRLALRRRLFNLLAYVLNDIRSVRDDQKPLFSCIANKTYVNVMYADYFVIWVL